MVHRCGRKPSGEEVSVSLLYSRTMDRLNIVPRYILLSRYVFYRFKIKS